jgi:hypothetical protein
MALNAISAKTFAMKSGACFASASRSLNRMLSFCSCGYVRTSICLSIDLTTCGSSGSFPNSASSGWTKMFPFAVMSILQIPDWQSLPLSVTKLRPSRKRRCWCRYRIALTIFLRSPWDQGQQVRSQVFFRKIRPNLCESLHNPKSLLSGYKPNRISWLELSSNSDWESNASNGRCRSVFS